MRPLPSEPEEPGYHEAMWFMEEEHPWKCRYAERLFGAVTTRVYGVGMEAEELFQWQV